MSFLDFFRGKRQNKVITQTWHEMGGYNASFSPFGKNIYKSPIVRACIRPLADFTGKAVAKCSDARIENIINKKPNMYMSGRDFLQKVRTMYELRNNCFIFIQRDDKGHPTGFYPVPYSSMRGLEYDNGLFIEFSFLSNAPKIVLPWDDLAVIRKDYFLSDICGDDNALLLDTLENIKTGKQANANALKATANLRGILKSTKGMLNPDDVKAQKDRFVDDYLNLENKGGIASLDSTQEFTPIKMEPLTANADQMKEEREDVYRFFGVNDKVLMSNMTSEEIEAFYEIKIEPFLVALATELESKIFTSRELAFGAWFIYEANRIQFASTRHKLQLREMVDRGALTPNEWRAVFNLAPVEGGDKPIRRLDTAEVNAEEGEENQDGDQE